MFVVDTGISALIACKAPGYDPHKGHVILQLVQAMEEKGLAEPCTGPCASIVVHAAKPHQENVSWYKYIWRLCVLYQRVNKMTRLYAYPIPHCDDVIDSNPTMMGYFILLHLATGYWQIKAAEATKDKLVFYTPEELYSLNRQMPMGAPNTASNET